MNYPTTTPEQRERAAGLARALCQAMRRAVDDATAPLVPCQECGRNLPTTELTRSGHCPRCAKLTLTLEEDSQ
jgi:Zn finger protein HypA/HybF involved in hydrogenase expression